jgi:hypothetical protein
MRVKKWTKDVNIFDKDFIIVPMNKNAHWHLAIICYPALISPAYSSEKRVDDQAEMSSNENSMQSAIQQQQNNDQNNLDSKTKYEAILNNTLESQLLHIKIEDVSYDEAESINENDIDNQIINPIENRVCIKMYGIYY